MNSVALTRSGTQLTGFGHWVVAREVILQLDPKSIITAKMDHQGNKATRVSAIDRIQYLQESGTLAPPAAEALRQSILARNRLWFDYWRPMNWAFLSGDRTEQPSSRDHRDPRVRWFPAEMNQFLPLIEFKEREIANQTSALARQPK